MRDIGFSTGALALGDFRAALAMLETHASNQAVELSALRESELPILMSALFELDLDRYRHVSIHAPSQLRTMTETEVVSLLRPCIERGWPVILHPDAIVDHGCWRELGALVCLENMDKRKLTGRTTAELECHFERLPEASLCLDLGHAKQVDPTMGVARQILRSFGDRLAQIHLSELDASCRHLPLSMATVWAVREIARGIPAAPVILESVVKAGGIPKELEMARKCFEVSQGSRFHGLVAASPGQASMGGPKPASLTRSG